MALLVKNAVLDGEGTDCLIENGVFTAIAPGLEAPVGGEVLDAGGAWIVPPFYNCHTHAPMNLFRGMADDLPLFDWLQNHIWPAEAKLTPADIRRGAEEAVAEMVRTGTVFFNDMYWHSEEILDAAVAAGMRACIGPCIIDGPDGRLKPECMDEVALVKERIAALPERTRRRIRFAYAPHAVYTVSEKSLCAVGEMAAADGESFVHVHVSETAKEVADCKEKYGMSPVALLDRCGLLGRRTVLAHCVHLSQDDMELIAERGATISHQPCSNYKLASGMFDYANAVEKHGCRFTIGTDGSASNNSLSMFGEMKLAALNAKVKSGDPTSGKAEDILKAATAVGAEAFGFDGGRIAVGALGDALLVDPAVPQMKPMRNLASNLVYAADTLCVRAVVCDGKTLWK